MIQSSRKIPKSLSDDANSLAVYLHNMHKFDERFCEFMTEGSDFTLRLEVRGNKGDLIHCRVYNDAFQQPNKKKTSVEK